MRITSGKACLLILVLLIAGLSLGCDSKEQDESINPPVSEPEQFLVQAIVDDCRSPEGIYIAHMTSTDDNCELVSPRRILKYEQGQLVNGDRDAFLKALTSNKPNDCPSFLFLFAYVSETSDSAVVDMQTYYNMGFLPNGRGGNAATWELQKSGNQWTVISKEINVVGD
jgi:hypothetical protein